MNQNDKYLQAVQRVLLALCKGFVKRGITLPIIVSMVKQSIIQAAVEQTSMWSARFSPKKYKLSSSESVGL